MSEADQKTLDALNNEPEKEVEAKDDFIGLFIGENYKVIEKIATGGMGVIYKGLQLSTNQEIVLKTIKPEFLKNQKILKKFVLERDIISKLNHPNIVKLLDFIILDQGPMFIVMEYLHGKPLNQFVQNSALALRTAVSILIQICDALDFAHSRGIIHRDLKPDNIFLLDKPSNFVKILDFGIAKLLVQDQAQPMSLPTLTGVIGTPKYMSPEQIAGHVLDHRTDIYSFGIIVYELLASLFDSANLRPYDLVDFNDLNLKGYLKDKLPLSNETDRLIEVVSKCLAFNKNHRFSSIAAAKEILEKSDQPYQTSEPPAPLSMPESPTLDLPFLPQEKRKKSRSPRKVYGGILSLLIISLLMAGGLFLYDRANQTKSAHISGHQLIENLSKLQSMAPIVLKSKKTKGGQEAKPDPDPSEKISIVFKSMPDGVYVKFENKKPVLTPFSLEFPMDSKKTVKFEAAKTGYQTKGFEISLDRDKDFVITLVKLYRPPIQTGSTGPKKKEDIISNW